MISLIIFSKDRALQLHALISSLKVNCDIFNRIDIICKWSNEDFEKGYWKISDSNILPEKCFIWQGSEGIAFKDHVMGLLKNDYICFMVDDLIAYRKLKNQKGITGDILIPIESSGIFSLRLGSNIKNCEQTKFAKSDIHDCCFTFDWTNKKKYFGNPISLDGHIYRTKDIKAVLKNKQFNNPNKLEIALLSYKETAPKYMGCFDKSVVVNIPINRVSNTASASFGEKYPHTARELNDRFLRGERMDWSEMDYSDIKMPHQEIELKFKQI